MRVVVWGTYDIGKPRVRILLEGLRANGVEVITCHRDVWGGVEDERKGRQARSIPTPEPACRRSPASA